MINHTKILFVIIISLLLIACEDSINPKEEFYEEYVLNCVIRSDTEFQTLRILKSFDVDGFNPTINSANPFVENAEVTLFFRGSEYTFKDSSVIPTTEQRFEGPIKYYYLDNFEPKHNRTEIRVEANLPDGTTLKAVALTPIAFSFESDPINNNIPPEDGSSYINISWVPDSYSYFQYYQTSLRIHYEEIINGQVVQDFIEVPQQFKIINNRRVLAGPELTRENGTAFAMTMVDTTLWMLADKVLNKDSVYIHKLATFHALALDENSASYYFSGLSENIYTVRLDESIYSNVEGGYGIFGALWEEILYLRIDDDFVQRYGFRVK